MLDAWTCQSEFWTWKKMVFFLAKRASFSQCYWDSVRCFCRRFVFFFRRKATNHCVLFTLDHFIIKLKKKKRFWAQKKSNWEKNRIEKNLKSESIERFQSNVYAIIYFIIQCMNGFIVSCFLFVLIFNIFHRCDSRLVQTNSAKKRVAKQK